MSTDVITTSASQQTRVDFSVSNPKARDEEAEMKIVGCDLHARQQSIAMVDTETGVLTEKVLKHEGNAVREFYAALNGDYTHPVAPPSPQTRAQSGSVPRGAVGGYSKRLLAGRRNAPMKSSNSRRENGFFRTGDAVINANF
jgi:hypothetical protein